MSPHDAATRIPPPQVKAVIIGEASGASMEAIMAVYPRHKAVADTFKARLVQCVLSSHQYYGSSASPEKCLHKLIRPHINGFDADIGHRTALEGESHAD